MNPELKAVLSRDFLSFARKAIGGLDGTTIGDDPYLRYFWPGQAKPVCRRRDPSAYH